VSLDLTDDHNRNDDSEAAAPPPNKTKRLGAILKRIVPPRNDECRTSQQLVQREMSWYKDLVDLEPPNIFQY